MLKAYCYTDLASYPNTRRSGYFVLFGGSLILWKCKTQVNVPLSSVEFEYKSIRHVTTKLTWLTRLHTKLAYTLLGVRFFINVYTKHIEINCHCVM